MISIIKNANIMISIIKNAAFSSKTKTRTCHEFLRSENINHRPCITRPRFRPSPPYVLTTLSQTGRATVLLRSKRAGGR
jgi:hypothetical protein